MVSQRRSSFAEKRVFLGRNGSRGVLFYEFLRLKTVNTQNKHGSLEKRKTNGKRERGGEGGREGGRDVKEKIGNGKKGNKRKIEGNSENTGKGMETKEKKEGKEIKTKWKKWNKWNRKQENGTWNPT